MEGFAKMIGIGGRRARAMRADASLIRPNHRKLVDVVLCVLHAAERLGVTVTQSDISKAAFLADLEMLEAYGVPITFDVYKAMKHGPVGSVLLDLLSEAPGVVARTGGIPWSRSRPGGAQGACAFSCPRRPVDDDILNPAEVDAMEAAVAKVTEPGSGQVSDITHGHPASVAAWSAKGDASSSPMDYALIVPHASRERLEDLAYLSRLAAGGEHARRPGR